MKLINLFRVLNIHIYIASITFAILKSTYHLSANRIFDTGKPNSIEESIKLITTLDQSMNIYIGKSL